LSIKPLAVRTLEFFAGIGGFKAACPWVNVQAALDIDQDAQSVYKTNFDGKYITCELASITKDHLADYSAELWWLSPPCTPFTRKGNQQDDRDPRASALMNLIQIATQLTPNVIALENVVGFEQSKTSHRILSMLQQASYEYRHCIRCPSEMQWPNRRRRVYLVAWHSRIDKKLRSGITANFEHKWRCTNSMQSMPIKAYLDPDISRLRNPELWLDEETLEKHFTAIDRIDSGQSITACFASSYGKAITKGGSYLWQEDGYRRFSPREVANLLGFPNEFNLPMNLSNRRLWHLLGNSLSLPVVRSLMNFTRGDQAD
jgi:DNA-cytosine methyltransferase